MINFNYIKALYRRNNYNEPCFWIAYPLNNDTICIEHGIVNKNLIGYNVKTDRNINDEINSRYLAKRKAGYKLLSELKDNVQLPVEGELLNYLNTYLPIYRTTIDESLLPMKAKVYDNTNNRLFKKTDYYLGQWKINGLRCFITAKYNTGNMFKPIKLCFQSCEGTYWNSLENLEYYLLSVLGKKLLTYMVEEHYALDGEIYLPGHTVNEINHFVKDPRCKENKLLQFWCYDLAIENTIQRTRNDILMNSLYDYSVTFLSKNSHLNNEDRLVILPSYCIKNDTDATVYRNKFIDLGFEGLIMRNPDAEYQYGKRNLSMIKYKKSTDGKFTIIDIYPEGIKRSNIPLFLCKNDINDSTFECHVGGSHAYQESILQNKQNYIGKQMYIEYGERSGVNQLPFHIKTTYIIN